MISGHLFRVESRVLVDNNNGASINGLIGHSNDPFGYSTVDGLTEIIYINFQRNRFIATAMFRCLSTFDVTCLGIMFGSFFLSTLPEGMIFHDKLFPDFLDTLLTLYGSCFKLLDFTNFFFSHFS